MTDKDDLGRIAAALESIAESLLKLASPPVVVEEGRVVPLNATRPGSITYVPPGHWLR